MSSVSTDLAGNTLYVSDIEYNSLTPGSLTGVSLSSTIAGSGGGSAADTAISGVSITSTGLTAIQLAGQVSGTGGWGMYIGRGTPTGLAATASLYINTATTLTASTILYGNTNGTATGWVAIT